MGEDLSTLLASAPSDQDGNPSVANADDDLSGSHLLIDLISLIRMNDKYVHSTLVSDIKKVISIYGYLLLIICIDFYCFGFGFGVNKGNDYLIMIYMYTVDRQGVIT